MVANNNASAMSANGHMITLNIRIPRDTHFHSMQFDAQMLIADLCQSIQDHLPVANDHDRKPHLSPSTSVHSASVISASEYGLFVNDSQQASRGYWLDSARQLNYYNLKNGVRYSSVSRIVFFSLSFAPGSRRVQNAISSVEDTLARWNCENNYDR